MIRIITDEGCLYDQYDSWNYIKYVLQRDFKNMADFLFREEILISSYFGDIELLCSEEDYSVWIVKVAENIFKE